MGKLEVHERGLLHRALSVIIRDSEGRLLLQKRQAGKYHSGGLWTNACCGHPRPAEATAHAAARRLYEEMGIRCPLGPLLTVTYRAEVGSELIEHELVHLYAGLFDGPVEPDPGEAESYAWVPPEELRRDVAEQPARYTAWFVRYCTEHWETIAGRAHP